MDHKYILVSVNMINDDPMIVRSFNKQENAESEANILAALNTDRKYVVCEVKSRFVAKVDVRVQKTEEP